MKFIVVASAKKVKSTFGIVFLMFFLGGCVTPSGQVGVITKCRQAEVAVDAAQKQYDEAIQNFAKKPKDEKIKNTVPLKAQSLLETEEKAYQACNRVKDGRSQSPP
jgi:hypothetical protein